MLSQMSTKPNLNSISSEQKNNENACSNLNDSLDDFKSPEKITVRRRKVQVKSQQKQNKKKRPAKTPTLYKYFNDDGFNQEHIQMAIAMSKSVKELENPEKGCDDSQPSTESTKTITQILAEFQYKSKGKHSADVIEKTKPEVS